MIFRAVLLSVILCLAACARPAESSAPLTSEAYVWQRQLTPAVREAVLRAAPILSGFAFQAAEITFGPGGKSTVLRFDLPLAETRPAAVSLVIRIPRAEGGLGSQPAHLKELSSLITALLAATGEEDIPIREIQLDYDCPESRLPLYARFLATLRDEIPTPDITITALPAWLDRPEFSDLARSAGRFVLQVHSLRLPEGNASAFPLWDLHETQRALRKASTLGIPFRLALPTYDSLVHLDAEGRPVSIFSEDATAAAPPSPGQRILRGVSDPSALADLVAALKHQHPATLTGLIWYRLPIETDRMNWSWPTFRAVLSGRQPLSRLDSVLVPQPGGATLIELRNTGETSLPSPSLVLVSWKNGSLTAADALGSYRFRAVPSSRSCDFFLSPSIASRSAIRPGQSLRIGWLRLENPADLQVVVR